MAKALYDVRSASAYVQTTTSGTTSVSAPTGSVACLFSADGASIRVTFDGSAASTTAGHLIPSGQSPVFFPLAKNMSFSVNGASTTVVTSNVTWLY